MVYFVKRGKMVVNLFTAWTVTVSLVKERRWYKETLLWILLSVP